MFDEQQQAQFEHLQYLQQKMFVLKSNKHNSIFVGFLIGSLMYWGTKVIVIAIAIGWIAAMIRGVADDLKRTYLLTEFNRAMCGFEGDLEELQEKLRIDRDIECSISKPFWKIWL